MVCVKEVYFVNKDVKGFRKRLAFLNTRIASRDANAAGSGFDRAEAQALRRLLSQVDEKGTACDPQIEKQGDWCIKFLDNEALTHRWRARKSATSPSLHAVTRDELLLLIREADETGLPMSLPSRAVVALAGN